MEGPSGSEQRARTGSSQQRAEATNTRVDHRSEPLVIKEV